MKKLYYTLVRMIPTEQGNYSFYRQSEVYTSVMCCEHAERKRSKLQTVQVLYVSPTTRSMFYKLLKLCLHVFCYMVAKTGFSQEKIYRG